ncbi:hypothetical protein BC835DRAFT_1527340 [Cytidiella melzeri]|nr:hypothetical protein BC835DRAFT_1527340 [Cytidiella melzeri]
MQFSTFLLIFAAIFTSTFHTMTVSAAPYGRPESSYSPSAHNYNNNFEKQQKNQWTGRAESASPHELLNPQYPPLFKLHAKFMHALHPERYSDDIDQAWYQFQLDMVEYDAKKWQKKNEKQQKKKKKQQEKNKKKQQKKEQRGKGPKDYCMHRDNVFKNHLQELAYAALCF